MMAPCEIYVWSIIKCGASSSVEHHQVWNVTLRHILAFDDIASHTCILQVTTLKKQQDLEAEAKRDMDAFATAAAASMSAKSRPPQLEAARAWTKGPHAIRIAALMEVALRPESGLPSLAPATISLANESLMATGTK